MKARSVRALAGPSFGIFFMKEYQMKIKESQYRYNKDFNTCKQGARYTCIPNVEYALCYNQNILMNEVCTTMVCKLLLPYMW